MAFWLRTVSGGGSPGIGNQLLPVSPAQVQSMLDSTAIGGDVIDMSNVGFAPGAPFILTVTRAFGSPVTIIGHPSQWIQVLCLGITNANVEFVNIMGSADQVGATTGDAGNRYTFYFRGSSGFAVHGCTADRGEFGIMIDNCSDWDVGYNLIIRHRDDGIRVQNSTTRGKIHHNMVADAYGQGRIYYDPTSGGTPYFWDFHGAPYVGQDVSHVDAISCYSGVFTDLEISDNVLYVWGQGIWLPDAANSYVRLKIARNDISVALVNTISVGDSINGFEVSSNIIRQYPNALFGNDTYAIGWNTSVTTNWWTDGLNQLLAGTSVGSGPINITSGSANGTGLAVLNAPGFTPTATILSLATKRVTRPSYTYYAGLPVIDPKGLAGVLKTGGYTTTAAVNDYLTVSPQDVYGYASNIENTYKTDWVKTGTGIVQAQQTGPVGMKYRPTSAGVYTPYIDYGDGVRVPGQAVTVS